MRDFPDDPIVACIERTGYPPWMQDEEPDEDGDETYYGNEEEDF